MGALYGLLGAHFVGDFILQTRWMADNKSSDPLALVAHVVVYMVPVTLVALWFGAPEEWVLVNGTAHFLTDAVTSRMTKALYRDGKIHQFFIVIGGDQTIHYLTMFGTWELLV